MDIKNLSSTDICLIIASCGEHKVAKLQFGDLYIEMGLKAKILDEVGPKNAEAFPQNANPQSNSDNEISEELKKINDDAFIQEELRTKQDQLDQLLIENPALAEKMIADGDFDEELEDADDESGRREQ